MMLSVIPPRSGTAFLLRKGQTVTVVDMEGEQVSDLVAFNAADIGEAISSGRSLDYASKLYLTTNDLIYSNRSNVMLRIVEDSVGKHDFLLTPCSRETFKIILAALAISKSRSRPTASPPTRSRWPSTVS
jgi:uncharacterized protein YcgI (DUF1989 family)